MIRVRARRNDAAPSDLQGHPNGLAGSGGHHLLRDVTDNADVLVACAGVRSGRIRDWVDVGCRDVEGRTVRLQLRERSERSLDEHKWMGGVDLLEPRVAANKSRRRQ